jgi:hypothetical protein
VEPPVKTHGDPYDDAVAAIAAEEKRLRDLMAAAEKLRAAKRATQRTPTYSTDRLRAETDQGRAMTEFRSLLHLDFLSSYSHRGARAESEDRFRNAMSRMPADEERTPALRVRWRELEDRAHRVEKDAKRANLTVDLKERRGGCLGCGGSAIGAFVLLGLFIGRSRR